MRDKCPSATTKASLPLLIHLATTYSSWSSALMEMPCLEGMLFAWYLSHLRSKRSHFSGSLKHVVPNMIRYELKFLDGENVQKRLTGTKINKKISPLLFVFDTIFEWLMEGKHINKNEIHYISNEVAISRNVGVTTFGSPCMYIFSCKIVIELRCKCFNRWS